MIKHVLIAAATFYGAVYAIQFFVNCIVRNIGH